MPLQHETHTEIPPRHDWKKRPQPVAARTVCGYIFRKYGSDDDYRKGSQHNQTQLRCDVSKDSNSDDQGNHLSDKFRQSDTEYILQLLSIAGNT